MTSTTDAIEEETFPGYKPEQFYPVHIGEVIKSPRTNYKIIGKLGYERKSTVDNTYYTIKVNTKHLNGGNREAAIYEHVEALGSQHIGVEHVRKLHEAFELSSPDGQHYCLVHPPMGTSIDEYQETFPGAQYPNPILKPLLCCLFKALDLLHSEAGAIHSDIQAQNILLTLDSPSSVLNFAAAEKAHPTPRKAINESRSIYTSRPLPDSFPPGPPVLCDFGHAVKGPPGAKHSGVIQPLTYRAPEVILGLAWGAEADIWNLGALTWKLA
ncbi:hypothetical protein V498_09802 [Pseudogymnoascus sp. VKM F-4517 (FW-2822)]|nr:hypothetical protein V498_09802 [Pseudogymnoascus sp. VKM F-4517 (FW-2822)]